MSSNFGPDQGGIYDYARSWNFFDVGGACEFWNLAQHDIFTFFKRRRRVFHFISKQVKERRGWVRRVKKSGNSYSIL